MSTIEEKKAISQSIREPCNATPVGASASPPHQPPSCLPSNSTAAQIMASFTPYVYFQCPCTESNLPTRHLGEDSPYNTPSEAEQDDRTFDPRAPRAPYNLYPQEHLLYCEDCHQIRCPRCVLDEIVTWYCPNCLFEVPSSTVKSEGNRFAPLASLAIRS